MKQELEAGILSQEAPSVQLGKEYVSSRPSRPSPPHFAVVGHPDAVPQLITPQPTN